jgi:tRNA (guanine-N(7)-)-methyltransferase
MTRFREVSDELRREQEGLKESQHRTKLWNGLELQYHIPNRAQTLALDLKESVPADFASRPLEVEIGPGKGEFLARRAARFPERFFIGIDRRLDRVRLTEGKLERQGQGHDRNWIILREDACSFAPEKLPAIDVLHLYQPDPWPKFRHHKHRFFRSPEARAFAHAVKKGGEFRLSTDHLGYYMEMLDLIKTWNAFDLVTAYEKNWTMSPALTHFEAYFMRQKQTVFKAIFRRR